MTSGNPKQFELTRLRKEIRETERRLRVLRWREGVLNEEMKTKPAKFRPMPLWDGLEETA